MFIFYLFSGWCVAACEWTVSVCEWVRDGQRRTSNTLPLSAPYSTHCCPLLVSCSLDQRAVGVASVAHLDLFSLSLCGLWWKRRRHTGPASECAAASLRWFSVCRSYSVPLRRFASGSMSSRWLFSSEWGMWWSGYLKKHTKNKHKKTPSLSVISSECKPGDQSRHHAGQQ